MIVARERRSTQFHSLQQNRMGQSDQNRQHEARLINDDILINPMTLNEQFQGG